MARKKDVIKKASLAEIFAANSGVIAAGIAALKTGDEKIIAMGTQAAKLSYDIRTQLMNRGLRLQDKAAAAMLDLLNDAAEALSSNPDFVLASPPKGKMGSKKTSQESLGTVGQLLAHIEDINFREKGSHEREASSMNDAGLLNKFEAAYLCKGGKLPANRAKATVTVTAKAPACTQ